MRRTQTIAAAASLTVAAAMLAARPALALALAPRGDIAACDASGDTAREDDCLQHAYLRGTKDGTVIQHGRVSLGLRLHQTMHGKAFAGEVQYRRMNADGKPIGPWSPMAGFALQPRHTRDGVVDSIASCAPEYRGTYEMRVVLAPTKPGDVRLTGRQGMLAAAFSSPTTQPFSGGQITSSPTPVTVTTNGACANAPADESNIEYFNMLSYNESIEIVTTPVPAAGTPVTGLSMALTCPPPPATYGTDLVISLRTEDDAFATTCNGAPITVDVAALQADLPPFCSIQQQVPWCDFRIEATSASTGTVYSTTLASLKLSAQGSTLIPQLQPATLPICNNTITFGLTQSPEGSLVLSNTAATPSVPMAYSSNPQTFFVTQIQDSLNAGS